MNEGWKCPNCGRCFAPTVNECPYCSGSGAEKQLPLKNWPGWSQPWYSPWHEYHEHIIYGPMNPQCGAGQFVCRDEVKKEAGSE